jgi:cold shock CspA family protein
MAHNGMQTGVIVRMGARGYGFLSPDGESERIFFHLKDCSNTCNVGDRVEFAVNPFADRGKGRRACEVRVLK